MLHIMHMGCLIFSSRPMVRSSFPGSGASRSLEACSQEPQVDLNEKIATGTGRRCHLSDTALCQVLIGATVFTGTGESSLTSLLLCSVKTFSLGSNGQVTTAASSVAFFKVWSEDHQHQNHMGELITNADSWVLPQSYRNQTHWTWKGGGVG